MTKLKNLLEDNPHFRKGFYISGAVLLAVKILIAAILLTGCSKDLIDKSGEYLTSGGVEEVFPANLANGVEVNPVIGVKFAAGTDASRIAASTLTLSDGKTEISGRVAFSGSSTLFAYNQELKPGTQYTARLAVPKSGTASGEQFEYSWEFATGSDHKDNKLSVISVNPQDKAKDVPLTTSVKITVNKEIKSWMQGIITVTLENSTGTVGGTLSFSDKVVTFTPSTRLTAGTLYTGKFSYSPNTWTTTTSSSGDDDEEDGDHDGGHSGTAKIPSDFIWSFTTAGDGTTGGTTDVTPPVVSSVVPAANAASVAVNSKITVTFSEPMNASTISGSSFTLKQGTTPVTGTVTYSGNTATFTPGADLAGGTQFTATVTKAVKDAAGNAMAADYSWSFTTVSMADVTPPQISSVTPANNATSVAVNTKPSVTFNEPMTASTITASSFTLKQGSTAIAGTVTLSGNTATFTPSADLAGGTQFTATVTKAVKDAAGNALAADYTWAFTTATQADVTPPQVSSVTPANNAASVAVTSTVTVTFNEPMSASTITASSFTLKQGSTAIAGTVTLSGNTATFTPSADLAGGTQFTATVTKAVKDAAGNALAADYTWNFTTVTVATGMSFANDVMPVLINQCNGCHTHGWTTSPTASTFYTNLVNGGYVNPTSPTTSKIYTMLNAGHASSVPQADRNKILTWMSEGSKNN